MLITEKDAIENHWCTINQNADTDYAKLKKETLCVASKCAMWKWLEFSFFGHCPFAERN